MFLRKRRQGSWDIEPSVGDVSRARPNEFPSFKDIQEGGKQGQAENMHKARPIIRHANKIFLSNFLFSSIVGSRIPTSCHSNIVLRLLYIDTAEAKQRQ